MATTTNVINLDFDVLKRDLIEYFKQYNDFNSANFEGSGLNIIADVMAYINYLTNVTANITANEMFLDSAQLRASVISKAKELGYVPKSITAPKAKLLLEFTYDPNNDELTTDNIEIPAGTKFLSNDHSTFTTLQTYVAEFENEIEYVGGEPTSKWVARKEIDVYEGTLRKYQYSVNAETETNRFLIPTEDVDISTLKVYVYSEIGANAIEYTENKNINILTPSDTVYFKHLNPDGYYEIVFGDGILGKKLEEGNIVEFEYLIVQHGEGMNGATYFTKAQTIGNYNKYKITCLQGAVDGSGEESIDSIKYFAPKFYKMQNRAVVKDDYETILRHEYPWIASLAIWGGQDNNPPEYGKIFFAIRSKYVDILSPTIKNRIEEDLIKRYNVVTVMPKVVDPDYVYIGTNFKFNYNPNKLNVSLEELKETIKLGCEAYFEEYIEDFNKSFYLSPMTAILDNLNGNLVSSTATIFVSKRFALEINVKNDIELYFRNKIVPGTVKSSYFGFGNTEDNVLSYIKDNGRGDLNIYNATTNNLIESYIGTINYDNGECVFTLYPFDLPEESFMVIYATPEEVDIKSSSNIIILKDKFIENKYWGLLPGTTIHLNPVEI